MVVGSSTNAIPTSLLSVREIHVGYGAVRALDGVSIHVAEGEVVSVIGSNGAGKTTLMKTVAGLLAARSGAITFEDRDITEIEAQDLVGRGISLVPEGRQVFGRMSVEENLMLGGLLDDPRVLGAYLGSKHRAAGPPPPASAVTPAREAADRSVSIPIPRR